MSEGLSPEVAQANYNRQQAVLKQAEAYRWSQEYRSFLSTLRSIDARVRDRVVNFLVFDAFDVDEDEIPRLVRLDTKARYRLGQQGGPFDKNNRNGGDAV